MGKMIIGSVNSEEKLENGSAHQPRIIERAVVTEKLVEVKIPFPVEKEIVKEVNITKDLVKSLENRLLSKITIISLLLNVGLTLVLLFK